ncbi:U2 snRNP-associated SURP motif-containing protein isoform X1 [Drosophila sulfurigaster albostrigata]|uniref:U2 snRNP-associated SURP motif-containing protein isoform X1 n=1 Tax=Drosophila sulfurigaster albostrigata TaxID=89887 RepID=UPI002D21D192|nr:U2 snRNP-associated SURP motif-containing protein isoform X1 [Drosophila sulfurigaster albostrigata]
MKRISEKKLEAFTVGTFSKRQLSKKELEEQKKKEDEAAAAHAFKEFVETFQEAPTASSKVWVKAGTYDAGSRREDKSEKGKLYKPGSKLVEKSASEKAEEYAKLLASDLKKDAPTLKKKNQEKKKSNLELFKEELRQIQEEREERHKYKHMAVANPPASQQQPQQQQQHQQATSSSQPSSSSRGDAGGSFDTGDPNTTNLYLGNLSPKISEQQLMEIFGRYGPLASIKIMWPRSEEEKQRGRNCGFVAYMSRKDAERALRTLNGRYIMGYEMRLGWGKTVPIMNTPIFAPQALLELTLPPPSSGLPFNAQPPPSEANTLPKKNYKDYESIEEKENMERVLAKSVVKVFIPTEKSVLNIIHRMIEFVIREGPMFEALIMSREMENPLFSFLFDNESPAHIYYRWKLYSLLQGDTPSEWREQQFRMFKGGPVWKPPVANFYTQGMPDELVIDPDAPVVHKGALSNAQRDRLEDLIRHLTPERSRIGDAMIFCIEHADAADEICECIAESLANSKTVASKKIARLYLVSDILHNCTVKVSNASFFRKSVEKQLLDIFESLHTYYLAIESRLKAEGFKTRVCNIIRTWEEWTIYPKEFLTQLRSVFLGRQFALQSNSPPQAEESRSEEALDEDIDGAPLSGDDKDDEDLDGVPLDGAALLKSALKLVLPDSASAAQQRGTPKQEQYHDEIDGVPLDEDLDGVPMEQATKQADKSQAKMPGFIPSKWETVDPQQVEAQAITTSKWDTLDPPDPPKFFSSDEESDDDESSQKYSDEKRQKLREIEVKVMQYQDELESGKRRLESGWTLTEQVEYYRKRLLKQTSPSESVDSPLSYMHSKSRSSQRSESPDNKYVSGAHYASSSRSSPSLSRSSRKRSHSPYSGGESSRSGRSGKRNRSRSQSDSPKRYTERSSRTSLLRRSPSPATSSGYSARSNRRTSPSPPRHRVEKHKHKHRH